MEEKRIAVEIYGEKIFLLSAEDESYLKSIAAYVDNKMVEIFRNRNILGEKPMIRSMLLGLNIADELFKEKEKNEKLESENQKNQRGMIKTEEFRYRFPANTEAPGDTEEKAKQARENEALKRELAAMKEKNQQLTNENSRLKKDLTDRVAALSILRREFDEYLEAFGRG